MKKTFLILSIFISFSILFSSCSKSDSTPAVGSPEPDTSLFVQYTYNGVVYRHEAETLNSLKKTILGYSGVDNSLRKLTLYMPLNVPVGTYNVTDQPSNVASYGANFTSGSSISIDGTAGTIIITVSNASTIEGTFQFSTTDTNGNVFSVTNGSFRADK